MMKRLEIIGLLHSINRMSAIQPRVAVAVAIFFLSPVGVFGQRAGGNAQTRQASTAEAPSFGQVQDAIRPGDFVVVTGKSGDTTAGPVQSVTPSSLVISARSGLREFSEGNTREILLRNPDSLFNGMVGGTLIGAGGGAGFLIACAGVGWDCGRSFAAPLMIVSAASGLGVGIGIDSLRKPSRRIYRSPDSFGDLQSALQIADGVTVTDRSGVETKGRLVAVSGSSLTVAVRAERREYAEANVLEVRRRTPDRVWNGALVGGGIGAGFGVWICRQANQWVSNVPKCALGTAGAGAGLGALIDLAKKNEKTVFLSNPLGRAGRLEVTPILTTGWQGVRLSVRLGSIEQ